MPEYPFIIFISMKICIFIPFFDAAAAADCTAEGETSG